MGNNKETMALLRISNMVSRTMDHQPTREITEGRMKSTETMEGRTSSIRTASHKARRKADVAINSANAVPVAWLFGHAANAAAAFAIS